MDQRRAALTTSPRPPGGALVGRLLLACGRRPVASARAGRDARSTPRTLLITLTGKDRPGVTSLVFDTLADFGVEVLDIEQIVLRRRLILGLLVSAPRDWKPLRRAMEQVGRRTST